ncbi:MAG: AAA family ATPase [Candidatus Rokubacteria bacterium]|nr:AAA family ATPase [Candidatus Rokubacteria bacterium]
MKCPRCQAQTREGVRFCEECGARLTLTCRSCGAEILPDKKFCGACGVPLADRFTSPRTYTPPHLAEKILTSRSALEGEKKLVTVLFSDLAGSTALAERLGPEAMHALLNRFFDLALDEIHRYEGTVNQFLGDGFMALFGAPVAHEDHARRAVLTALGIQRRLPELGPDLAVRMGLNTGPVVVGKIGDNLRMDYTAVGDTTHLAARLQQLAEPGAILIGEATYRLVQGDVRAETLGALQVRGKTEPVTPYRVTALSPRRSPLDAVGARVLSPFVGRERELAALGDALAQVERGQGQIVGMVGEPGVGKSRLLYEFRRGLAGQRVTFLEGRCVSYGSAIPLLPVLDIIRNNCGITDLDSPEAVAAKVRYGLEEVEMDPEEGAPYLLHLLGIKDGADRLAVLTAEAIRERTFGTLRQMSLKGSRRRTLIFAVEDLHWIDRTSEDYFASLIESLAGAAILLLTTYRPGYRPPWMDKSYATQLALRPLSVQDSLVVVQSVVERTPLPESVARLVLDKAEGNPFFIEELTRVVLEHGALSVPDTIQGVLMARIDRLPDESKRVLQTASVVGREVPLRLLTLIWDGPARLERELAELKRSEFLYEQAGTAEPVYVFKHALTQEVAYESLLTPRRQALHAAAGRALEALYAGRLEEVYDRLAYHYSRTDDAPKAVEYLTRFAEQAAGRYAHTEALTALQSASIHTGQLPVPEQDRRVLDLALRQARSLHFLGRRREIVELLGQHQGRLERLQDPAVSAEYCFELGFAWSFLGDREQAGRNVMRAFAAAVECGDRAIMGKANILAGMERAWSGHPAEAVELGRQAVALLEGTREPGWLGWAHFLLSYSNLLQADFEAALEAVARVEAIGETIGDARLKALAASSTGLTYTLMGEWDKAIEANRRSIEQSPDPFETALFLGFLGLAHLEKGDLSQATPLLEQALQEAKKYRSTQIQAWFSTMLADAYRQSGRLAEAEALARNGLEVCREVNYMNGVAWAEHVLGRIAQARGALDDAGALLSSALRTYDSIRARAGVGYVYLSLAELAHARGQGEVVATHLRAAHALFRDLRAPGYLERTERLAAELGVSLRG